MKFSSNLHSVKVEIDGRKMRLQELTGTERDQYETSMVSVSDDGKITVNKENVKAKLLHVSLKNGNGGPAYESVDDVGALPARVVNKLFDEAKKLSGIDDGVNLGND